jgi:hypothetical protein
MKDEKHQVAQRKAIYRNGKVGKHELKDVITVYYFTRYFEVYSRVILATSSY